MSQNKEEKGVVYVLTNPRMPGLVKIGMTNRSNIKKRMKELYGTGVPVPFKCEYACLTDANRCKELEHALHIAFHPYRINSSREFFEIEPYQAISILKYQNQGGEDLTEEFIKDINSGLTPSDKTAIENEQKKQSKRPPLNYKKMQIPVGGVLVYDKDHSITCTVASDRKVLFEGELTSLSTITQKLQNKKYTPQPTPYWSYEGKPLSDIYDETYPMSEEE